MEPKKATEVYELLPYYRVIKLVKSLDRKEASSLEV